MSESVTVPPSGRGGILRDGSNLMSTTLAAADVMASTNIAKRVRRSSMRVVLLRSSWTWTLWRPDGAAVPESDGDEPTIEAVAGQRCRCQGEEFRNLPYVYGKRKKDVPL